MKFMQARVGAAAEAATAAAKAEAEALAKAPEAAKAEAFKVEPAATEGTEVAPAPGQNDAPVRVRAADDYLAPVTATTQFIGSHSYEEDIKALLEEVDQSENKVKGLKLRIVEKENFVDSLAKREDMLQEDLKKDKEAVENLHAHVRALKARAERIKKEKQLRLLEASFHEYSAAAKRIGDQASELSRIKTLLYAKMKGLVGEIEPLKSVETKDMAKSISISQAAADAAPAEEAAADAQEAAAVEQAVAAPVEPAAAPAEAAPAVTEEAAPALAEEAAVAEVPAEEASVATEEAPADEAAPAEATA